MAMIHRFSAFSPNRRLCIALALSVVVSRNADAQVATTRGLLCGDSIVSLDLTRGPSLDANRTRQAQINALYSASESALLECASHGGKLPGCQALDAWRAQVERAYRARGEGTAAAGIPAHYGGSFPDAPRAAAEGAAIADAMRVLAAAQCEPSLEKAANATPTVPLNTSSATAGASAACLALLKAESDSGHTAITTPYKGFVKVAGVYKDPKAPPVAPAAPPAVATMEAVDFAVENCANDAFGALQEPTTSACMAAAPPAVKAAAHHAVTWLTNSAAGVQALPAIRLFDNVLPFGGLPVHATAALTVAVDAVAPHVPHVVDFEHDNIPTNAFNNYFFELFRESRTKGEVCREAEFYVEPTGSLVHNQDSAQLNTICVDTALYSINRPFIVEVVEYPIGDGSNGWQPRSQTFPVDIGKVRPFRLTRRSMVRITVRGYPSGASLRALALQGSVNIPTAADLDSIGDGSSAGSSCASSKGGTSGADGAAASALSAIAKALTTDKTYQDDLRALNQRVAALPAPVAAGIPPISCATANSVVDDAEKVIAQANALIARQRPKVAANASAAQVDEAMGENRGANAAAALLPGRLEPEPPVCAHSFKSYASLNALAQKLTALSGAVADAAASATTALNGSSSAATAAAQKKCADTTATISRLCRLSTELVPVVDEDILLDEPDLRRVHIFDYDFDAGFQTETHEQISDKDLVFIRVRHVRPGGSVAVVLDKGSPLVHATALIGLPTATTAAVPSGSTGPGESTGSSPATADDPDSATVEARSTQILPLGRLAGGTRFDLAVCARTASDAPACSVTPATPSPPQAPSATDVASSLTQDATKLLAAAAPASTAKVTAAAAGTPASATPKGVTRVIAANTVVVHTLGYIGVRAGLGANVTLGDVRSLAGVPSSSGTYVHDRPVTGAVNVPLLLAVYPQGRDSAGMPPRFSWGFVGGVDALTVVNDPTFMLGTVLDFYGFGITFGSTLQPVSSIDAPDNTAVAAGGSLPSTTQWHPGFFGCLTSDFDIFTKTFKTYVSPAKFPVIGATQ